MRTAHRARDLARVFLVAGLLGGTGLARGEEPWRQRVDGWVLDAVSGSQEAEYLVFLSHQADLTGATRLAGKATKGRWVSKTLREVAARTQGPILEQLRSAGVEHRTFWIANMIWVKSGEETLRRLARRPDVQHIYANPEVALDAPVWSEPDRPVQPAGIEPSIEHTNAPSVFWAHGFTGQGVVIGGQDTGYDWGHPALKNAYRGWDGVVADHNYNWHDAVHSGGGVCGPDSPEPCDDQSHGTHTMGTMVGDDRGSNQIGMAPGARWIGCRNMNGGVGTPATYSECFQWFVAPTDLNDQNPDPSKAPHVINNSWSCPPSEGCTDPDVLRTVAENARAAGILVVVSAGNSGPGCSTVSTPAAIYDASFTVGATDNSDLIASFSSRGSVTVDGSNRLKPDISAPGVSIRSSVPGGGYSRFSGTSMAGPHVAGMAALVMSASSCLIGNVDGLERHIMGTALPQTTSQQCGGVPGSSIPNNTYGWGAIRSGLPAGCDGLALTQGGSCPGVVNLSVSGATPGYVVRLGWSFNPGSKTLPKGPCAGTVVDLDSPQLLTTRVADADGQVFIEGTVGDNACGVLVQALDKVTCAVSNVEVIE